MNVTEALRAYAVENEMDYFGVAPVERLNNLPEHFRPTDLFPEASCVIVMGMKILNGAMQAHRAAFSGKREQFPVFTQFGFNKVNELLNIAALKIVRRIEKQYGGVAMPMPSGEPHNEELWMGTISNRYAALCAGLGEMTWSGLVATPKDGPRVRWVCVVTDLELDPSPLYSGPRLCTYPACRICVECCPTQALSGQEKIRVKIGEFETVYAKRNKPRCRCATSGLVKGTPGRLQADMPEVMDTMDDWYEFNKRDNHWHKLEHHHGNDCLLCMARCPIGGKRGEVGQ